MRNGLATHGQQEAPRLRVAMLAPPWIPVPPIGYGGIEDVVAVLSRELVRRGHDVTLFAAPGSDSPATVRPLLEDAHPRQIGSSLYEADHVACAFAEIDAATTAVKPFDVVHDHSGLVAVATADRLATPLIHTVHLPFDRDRARFYERHGHKALLVCLSTAQRRALPHTLPPAPVIPNPVSVRTWPLRSQKEAFLLWMGRIDPVKGPERAVEAARLARMPLVLAGPIQAGQEAFFAEQIAPRIDGSAVRYIGEAVGPRKRSLLAGAAAMLMPIRWDEPFGMVMVEAMACGTPVIAFPEGATTEIVIHGVNGFLVADEREMAAAVEHLSLLSALDCRQSVESRYDVALVATAYEKLYRAQSVRGERQPFTMPSGGTGATRFARLPRATASATR